MPGGQDIEGRAPQAGEDLGEQAVAGRQPQDLLSAWRTSRAGTLINQRRRIFLAAADAVTCRDVLAAGSGGELVQPGGRDGGLQRAPRPGRIDRGYPKVLN